jgi:biopolymer transport protein ExbB
MKELITEFNAGGPFMYLILSISIFALAVVIYKVYTLWFKGKISVEEVTSAVVKQVESSNYARALQYCTAKVHPLTNMMKAVLLRANKPEKEIRRAVEVAAADELPRFKKLTSILPHLSNISTMVGLLGTIRGLIIAFSGMEAGDAVKRQEALSTGIAIAFRATFFALSVAAALILFYVILNTKQTAMLSKMEHAITSLIDVIVANNNKKLAAASKEQAAR